MSIPFDKTCISIKGARTHNLKNISVDIPKGKFVVITGVSGSGKSSLAFDTLYAEGRRRYVESLSSYARQFLERASKPDVDAILNLSPSIAIEQKNITKNARSTVGTVTEIYDYLRMLYARVGKMYAFGADDVVVKKHTVHDVTEYIMSKPEGEVGYIGFPLMDKTKTLSQVIRVCMEKGFSKIITEEGVLNIEDEAEKVLKEAWDKAKRVVVVDKFLLKMDEDIESRIADSVEVAFAEGGGYVSVVFESGDSARFCENFEHNGNVYIEPTPQLFSFNSPMGACETCKGFGSTIGIDMLTVFPRDSVSLKERLGNILRYQSTAAFFETFLQSAKAENIPLEDSFSLLTPSQKQRIWNGSNEVNGLEYAFKCLEKESSNNIFIKACLNPFRGHARCPSCNGGRLRKEALQVKIQGKNISEVCQLTIGELLGFILNLNFSDYEKAVAKIILDEITKRTRYLLDVGLTYLTLDRETRTLSGGESQRINLASSLSASLVGAIYVLDEPSIGLHQKDSNRLVQVIKRLRDSGITVVVVEHDREIMESADYIIDIGPGAGQNGGEIVFHGTPQKIESFSGRSLTASYLSGEKRVQLPKERRRLDWKKAISIKGAREHNLKNISTNIPLHALTCVTGVSGSGKSSFVYDVLHASLLAQKGERGEKIIAVKNVTGGAFFSGGIHLIDQTSIGRTTRSNPATYIKAFDDIRDVFAKTDYARKYFLAPSMFSFNVPGGRCEECEGEGIIVIEMQFLADVEIECESCKGKRYKEDILKVLYKSKSIADVLSLTISEARIFFADHANISKKLEVLEEVGLGYVQLGQPATSLSGGEAQRLKLASFIANTNTANALFIFDEPTTGLHFDDIAKLVHCFNRLLSQRNTLLVVEHNLDIIKQADWVIDLGPEAGEAGGYIVAEGTPETIAANERSYTGQELRKILGNEITVRI